MDEDRLLTPKEIDAVFAQWSEETQGNVSKALGNTYSQAIAKSQLAKDMEWENKFGFIKEAEFKEKCANCDTPLTVEGKIQKAVDKVNTECQERVRELADSVDLIFALPRITIENAKELWQAIKKREGIDGS